MNRVSFLGYGRFGAALAGRLIDAGLSVRAMDPHATVPEEARARSLADLVSSADLVIIAVPVGAMRAAFEAIRPQLSSAQTVIDVGSVKIGPARHMASVFGDHIPWVATHPLFGPASLARGERPLRAVVCPNASHPAAVLSVTAVFERIGCEVIHSAPDDHDRAMAYTHALAFFIAKGLLDAGTPPLLPFAPPSFQAIARTIELVRADAGHLFEALHRENPYSAEARRRFLDALAAIDRRLDHPGGRPRAPDDDRGPVSIDADPPSPVSALAIPDLGDRSPALREARELIDEVDQEIVGLLARRAELARRAARAKAEIGHGVLDPDREARLREQRRAWAIAVGLDPASIDDIFQAILGFSRRVQEKPGGGAA